MAKKETTLKCVLTLTIIAVICGLLLAVLNPLLYVEPTVDDITDNITLSGEYTATVETLNKDLAKGVKGGSVQLVAKIVEGENEYIGMKIKTNSDGQLGECDYAVLIDRKTNKIVQAKYITDGATAGRNYETWDKGVNSPDFKGSNFSGYLVEITSADTFNDFSYPKAGATKTYKAANNCFIITANYYYNQYVLGGAQNEG